MTYLSFEQQVLHYVDRPHQATPTGPVGGPAAWRGAELRDSEEWIDRLGAHDLDELDAALEHARASGKALEDLTADDFPLPTLGDRVAGWRRDVADGRGFVLVRGMPVQRWGPDASEIVCWCLGQHLGTPGAQNPDGELLGHVTDYREPDPDGVVRKYRTSDAIAFHCDTADAVGLLCLESAGNGGLSRIVSSVTVHDVLRDERPDLADRLFDDFLLDTRNESEEGIPYLPVPAARYDGERLRTFWHSPYFRSVTRHQDVAELDELTHATLDAFDEVAGRDDLKLDMDLRPGDLQVINNHTIVHGRTAYEDDGERRRHLLRLWLTLP